MKTGALAALLLAGTLLFSQSGCFTVMAASAATDSPLTFTGGGSEAACLVALEFVLWPVLIGDVMVASIICLATIGEEEPPLPDPPAESPK